MRLGVREIAQVSCVKRLVVRMWDVSSCGVRSWGFPGDNNSNQRAFANYKRWNEPILLGLLYAIMLLISEKSPVLSIHTSKANPHAPTTTRKFPGMDMPLSGDRYRYCQNILLHI